MEPAKKNELEEGKDKSEPTIKVAEAKSVDRPARPLWDFDREFQNAFENFFNRDWLRSPRMGFTALRESVEEKMPMVNVIDREEELLIEAELPNVSKDDLEVSVSENAVTIKASTRKEKEDEKGDYRHKEISTRYYSRVVPLPVAVLSDEAKAELKDGMLTLTFPKSEQSKRVKIEVD
jgi:HSP20 family protein